MILINKWSVIIGKHWWDRLKIISYIQWISVRVFRKETKHRFLAAAVFLNLNQ